MKENVGSAKSAAIWALIEKFATQAVSFVIGIVLARLLSPSDYGTVGMMAIFFSISYVFIDSGFGSALIRKRNRTEADLSTVFFFNLSASIFFYILLWITAPLIADFYNEQVLVNLIRISGLTLIISSFCTVQNIVMTANLQIRTQTYISLISQIPSGCLAIYWAYKGWGVYALVFQSVIAAFIRSVSLCIVAKWKPTAGFSKESFKYLFGFGSKLVGANLIGTFFNNIYTLLIGKYIGKNELGYFSKGDGLKIQVFSVFTGMVQRIALPILSRHQENKEQLTQDFRLVMRMLICVNAYIAAIMTVGSRDLVIALWTEKWEPAATITSLLVLGFLWVPLSTLSLSLLQVVNKTGTILKLEFPKKAVYIIFIIIGFQYGVYGLCCSLIASNIFGTMINMYAARKVLTYDYKSQIWDILRYILLAYSFAYIIYFSICHFSNHLINFCFLAGGLLVVYTIVLIKFKDRAIIQYSNYLPIINRLLK